MKPSLRLQGIQSFLLNIYILNKLRRKPKIFKKKQTKWLQLLFVRGLVTFFFGNLKATSLNILEDMSLLRQNEAKQIVLFDSFSVLKIEKERDITESTPFNFWCIGLSPKRSTFLFSIWV